MLDILLLVWLCTSLGKVLRSKGRKPLVFQILLVLSWFGAEFCAGIIYGVFQSFRGAPADMGFDFTLYVVALLGAACAAGFWFLIAYLLPSAEVNYAPPAFAGQSGTAPMYQPPQDPNNPYAPPRTGD